MFTFTDEDSEELLEVIIPEVRQNCMQNIALV